jgi:hypothetical protein
MEGVQENRCRSAEAGTMSRTRTVPTMHPIRKTIKA